MPLFLNHDRQKFEITCYAQVMVADGMTQLFQQHSDHWRNIVGLLDEAVAEQIRQDGIDILVDLALHTGHNRLLVFAQAGGGADQLSWLLRQYGAGGNGLSAVGPISGSAGDGGRLC